MPTAAEFTVHKPELQVRISREFNATRQHVWDVINDPQLIGQWWGPARYSTVVDEMDVRVGGKWRYIHKGDGDQEYAFNGVYKEVDPPRKIVMTFEFEPMPGHINTQTMTLTQLQNRTRMDVTVQFDNLADLEGMVGSGMKDGNLESYDRLDKVLEKGK